ncbi:MAG TPA: pepsin/retropepsin-like aspartic protease family protein [Aliidongia sp.]|nr:pepsin/retropepsin-like aspartic protease family protein [Aliidongia sp.]
MRISWSMISGALVLAAGLLLAGESIAADCQLKAYGSLTVAANDQEQMVFPVTIENHTLQAAFEPALSRSQIGKKVLKDIGKAPRSGYLADTVTLDKLVFGKLTVASPTLDVIDLPPGIDIELGQNVLRLVDLELDLAKGTIRLFSPEHCPDQAVYWAPEHYEFDYEDTHFGGQFEASVNGHPVKAILAPGSAYSRINISELSALGITKQGENDLILDTLEFGGIRLKRISAGTIQYNLISHESSSGTHLKPTAVEAPTLLVGTDVLRKLRLFVANGTHKIYFTVGDGA